MNHRIILRAKASLIAAVLITMLAGCNLTFGGTQDDTPWSTEVPTSFDFAMSRVITIDATITIEDEGNEVPYAGLLGVYTFDTETELYILLGSDLIVNGEGEFPVVVPSSVSSLTLRPDSIGLFERDYAITSTTTELSVTINPDDLDLTAVPAGKSAKSIITNAKSIYSTLGTFDSLGKPDDLETTRDTFTDDFISDLNASLPEYSKLPIVNQSFVDSVGRSNFAILESNTEISLTFISEGAGYKNSLGYFVFDTGNTPASISAIPNSDMVIALPNASFVNSGGNLRVGDKIKLWNPRTNTTKFNPGISIGWFLIANGFSGSKVTAGTSKLYSLPDLNPESTTDLLQKTHVAFLKNHSYVDEGKASLILAFEDMHRLKGSDDDFNDAVFAITVTPDTAIDTSQIPQMTTVKDTDLDGVPDSSDAYPTDAERAYNVYWPSAKTYGTALYEDLWPSKGDYDFNDMVAFLQTKTVKNASGEAVEMLVNAKLQAAGAGMPSGLALSLPVASSKIASVTGQSLSTNLFTTVNGVESDESNSIIPIFTDSHTEFGIKGNADTIVNTNTGEGVSKDAVNYTVKISFNTGLKAAVLTTTPDFFIVVNNTRGKEVHTIGKKPSSKATTSLFNTVDDASSATSNAYYKSKTGAPWALIIPSEMPWAVERADISLAHLKFASWVKSSGTSYTDWYEDKTGYRNSAEIY